MQSNFVRLRKTLGTSGGRVNAAFINGCCYGKDNNPDKGDYQKLCGQRFWELISGDEDLYMDIIEPIGQDAVVRNEEFLMSYNQMINKFTREFALDYCNEDGIIDWMKLIKYNSEA